MGEGSKSYITQFLVLYFWNLYRMAYLTTTLYLRDSVETPKFIYLYIRIFIALYIFVSIKQNILLVP